MLFLELNQWTSWLGMDVDPASIERLGELSFLAHCLWEMTFCGYDQDTIDARNAELDQSYQDVKSGKSDLFEMIETEDGEKSEAYCI